MALEDSQGEIRAYRNGEVIFREGTEGEHMYVVLEGTVCIRKEGDLVKTVLCEIGPGQIFGELALLGRKPHSASAVASGPTRVLMHDRETFLTALIDDPELAIDVIGSLAERLRDTTDKLQRIATQHVLDRTEMALVEQAVLKSDIV